MNLIQSLWTKPFVTTPLNRDHLEFYLMSAVFSCLQIRRYYDKLKLYTDNYGKQLLVDVIGAPYTEVDTCLNDLSYYDNALWTVGKLYAYQRQEEAFLHIDCDIYLFDKLSQKTLESPVIALHIEEPPVYTIYTEWLKILLKDCTYIPDVIKAINLQLGIKSINAGILGGTDISFFKKYTDEAFRFVNNNLNVYHLNLKDGFNIMFEQLLLYIMCEDKSKIAYCVSNEKGLYSLRNVPNTSKLIHARSDKRSRNRNLETKMYRLMRKYYPKYHEKVMKTVNSINQIIC